MFPAQVRALGVGVGYAISNAIFGGSAENWRCCSRLEGRVGLLLVRHGHDGDRVPGEPAPAQDGQLPAHRPLKPGRASWRARKQRNGPSRGPLSSGVDRQAFLTQALHHPLGLPRTCRRTTGTGPAASPALPWYSAQVPQAWPGCVLRVLRLVDLGGRRGCSRAPWPAGSFGSTSGAGAWARARAAAPTRGTRAMKRRRVVMSCLPAVAGGCARLCGPP